MTKQMKTVYRYDARGSGFKKAAMFLIILSALLAVFGVYWVLTSVVVKVSGIEAAAEAAAAAAKGFRT